jgi:hypothetical protein
MTLTEFKTKLGVQTLPLYKSTIPGSTRFVGSYGAFKYCTTENFKSKESSFVYETVMKETGEIIYFISNKEQREADLTL